MAQYDHFALIFRQHIYQRRTRSWLWLVIMLLSAPVFQYINYFEICRWSSPVVMVGVRFTLRKWSTHRLCAMRMAQGKNFPSSL